MSAILAVTSLFALPLGNWRMPFFKIASDFESSVSSPSRMFWDRIESATLFDSSLWNRKSFALERYWTSEPALTAGGKLHGESAGGSSPFYKGDFYHEAQYGNMRIGQSFGIHSRYEDDTLYPAHRDRSIRGRMEEAFLEYFWRHGFLRIGRMQRSWGPFPDRSLILSANPYSYDALEFQFHGGLFEFRHLFAPFSSHRSSWDSDDGTTLNRYLTAHSLNLKFGTWVTVGVTESVLFTRNKEFPDMQYINPVSLYSLVNANQEGNGNLLFAFQWNIHPVTEKVSLRGQVVLDDFQMDDRGATDKEPAHWGLDAGIFWYDPFCALLPHRHLIKMEYTHASPWLYTVPDADAAGGERYTYYGKSLGLSFTDGSLLSLGAVVVPSRLGAYGFSVSYGRRGGNTERSSWQDRNHTAGLPFDTHEPVESRIAAGAQGYFYIKNLAAMCVQGDLGAVRNRGNRHRESLSFDPSIALELTVHFSDIAIKLP